MALCHHNLDSSLYSCALFNPPSTETATDVAQEANEDEDARKRQRVDSRGDDSDINGPDTSSLSTPNGGNDASTSGGALIEGNSCLSSFHSLQALNDETHTTCNKVLAAEQDDKSTGGSYMRALNRYKIWWSADQARAISEDPMRKEIPALPITAAKAAAFLSYKSTRPKRKQGSNTEVLGTRVGSSQVSQVINGLEYHCHHRQHEYLDW
ncbi:hypothetical protein FPV67DRAFT_1706583 [Lyophyllum atratum]|nr:hypothetical protein FPV67DRAFT_1706583 [Lyophyllum atratum]